MIGGKQRGTTGRETHETPYETDTRDEGQDDNGKPNETIWERPGVASKQARDETKDKTHRRDEKRDGPDDAHGKNG